MNRGAYVYIYISAQVKITPHYSIAPPAHKIFERTEKTTIKNQKRREEKRREEKRKEKKEKSYSKQELASYTADYEGSC
jgi:hypothetical protein